MLLVKYFKNCYIGCVVAANRLRRTSQTAKLMHKLVFCVLRFASVVYVLLVCLYFCNITYRTALYKSSPSEQTFSLDVNNENNSKELSLCRERNINIHRVRPFSFKM